jgi:hypothetical protein
MRKLLRSKDDTGDETDEKREIEQRGMPDSAIQAGPSDQPASDARERERNHVPEQQARNQHTEQVKLVFHAAISSGSNCSG